MASLKKRGNLYSIQFWWDGKQYIYPLGTPDLHEATQIKSRAETALDNLQKGKYPKASRLLSDGHDVRDIIFPTAKTAPLLQGDIIVDDGNPITVRELVDSYGEHLEAHVSYGHHRRAKSKLLHIVGKFGDRRVATLDTVGLDEYILSRKKAEAKPLTINGELSTVRAMFNWAVDAKKIDKSPIQRFPMLKLDDSDPFLFKADIDRIIDEDNLSKEEATDLAKRRMVLAPADVDALIQFAKAKKSPLYLPLMVVTTTGIRRSELVRLKRSDFHPAIGRLEVHSGKGARHKRKNRTIDVHKSVLSPLIDHHRTLPKGDRLLFPIFDIPDNPQARRGADTEVPIDDRRADRASRLLDVLLEGSEFERLGGWHALRHSFITICVWKGYTFEQISQWTGHISPETQKRYTHYSSAASKTLMDGLPFQFSEVSS